ncbi:hypothetical protein V466_26075 [Pseudomonas mandelii PD30]|uniref:AlgX/AlgJ SGNH hydrolase-like domain-containing protein n=2 Tax=Pseudomonas TaxID=286 RepID=A0A059KW68_9PSED|nr:hypothetical protein V466_26075 [Pseudomonas mandelii PD30]
MSISGREIGNQMLVHNVALFSQYPTPADVTTGYVGTSRSKVLHPNEFGIPGAVVGAGNTYNEITYGLLLQAEILRLKFPELKRVYIETSLLLRRPGRLIVEADHLKYLPLLRSMETLCPDDGSVPGCQAVFEAVHKVKSSHISSWKPEVLGVRNQLRFTELLVSRDKSIPVLADPLLKKLDVNGEKKAPFRRLTDKSDMLPDVTNEHVKVQRLREISSNAPWDGLFDLIALWGKKNNIQIVFFQPPVRSDLYGFQVQYGLQKHVDDLIRVSSKYNVPFIDLDKPELGYMNDWTLFSDEDHLETCIGTGLLILALEKGYESFSSEHQLLPVVEQHMLQKDNTRLETCGK